MAPTRCRCVLHKQQTESTGVCSNATQHTAVIAATEGNKFSVITYPNVESTPTTNIANDKIAASAAGFDQLSGKLAKSNSSAVQYASDVFLFGSLSAIDNQGPQRGTPAFQFPAVPAELEGDQNVGSAFAGSFLRRILEHGPTGFSLSDIGTQIDNIAQLQQRLDAMDGVEATLFDTGANACLDVTIADNLVAQETWAICWPTTAPFL